MCDLLPPHASTSTNEHVAVAAANNNAAGGAVNRCMTEGCSALVSIASASEILCSRCVEDQLRAHELYVWPRNRVEVDVQSNPDPSDMRVSEDFVRYQYERFEDFRWQPPPSQTLEQCQARNTAGKAETAETAEKETAETAGKETTEGGEGEGGEGGVEENEVDEEEDDDGCIRCVGDDKCENLGLESYNYLCQVHFDDLRGLVDVMEVKKQRNDWVETDDFWADDYDDDDEEEEEEEEEEEDGVDGGDDVNARIVSLSVKDN